MNKTNLVILFFLAWILTPNIYAQYEYPTQGNDIYQPTMSSDINTQATFQSASATYYNNTYTVPFAAEDMEIGSTNPYSNSSTPSGRRNVPPGVTGPPSDFPGGLPGNQPLGDGMWFLLFCAVGVVLRITFKRTEKANIQ
jgi:hypothetical protein